MEWTAVRCKWTRWHDMSSRSDVGSVDVRSSSPSPTTLKSCLGGNCLEPKGPGYRGGCLHNNESISVPAYLLSAATTPPSRRLCSRLPSAQMTNALLVNYANLCCDLWVSCTQLAQDAACHSTSWIPTNIFLIIIYLSIHSSIFLSFFSTYLCIFPSPIHPLSHLSFFIYSIFLSTCVSISLSIFHPSSTFLSSIFLHHISLICISISHLSKCLSSIYLCLSICLSIYSMWWKHPGVYTHPQGRA